jgi:hypothetical protein
MLIIFEPQRVASLTNRVRFLARFVNKPSWASLLCKGMDQAEPSQLEIRRTMCILVLCVCYPQQVLLYSKWSLVQSMVLETWCLHKGTFTVMEF